MVGHTGSIPAAVEAIETVDPCLGEVVVGTYLHGPGVPADVAPTVLDLLDEEQPPRDDGPIAARTVTGGRSSSVAQRRSPGASAAMLKAQ